MKLRLGRGSHECTHKECPCGGECQDGALFRVRHRAPTRGAPTVGRQGDKECQPGLAFTFFNNLESLKTPAIPNSGSFPRVHRRFGLGTVRRESVPAVAGIFCHLLARGSTGARPGRRVETVNWGGCEGRHRAGTYGGLMGLAGRGLARHLRLGTWHQYRHPVDKACCRRGGVAGAEPPHKGGPKRPDRPKIQGLGARGQGLVVSDGNTFDSELSARWERLCCYLRREKVRPHSKRHPFSHIFLTPHSMSDSMAGPVANVLDDARKLSTHDVSISYMQ